MSIALKNCYAPSPNVVRAKPTLLGTDPKENNVLYCVGKAVVIRSLINPIQAELYLDHSYDTTVARYSPSGFYIASGDVSGRIRIWDTVNKEHICKLEVQVLSGPILDLQWSDDSKRIVACGDGREKYAVAFMWDTGSSVGDLGGHSKCVQSCDIKQTRPYRIATGSEDMLVNFFEGPPFKFSRTQKDHTRFVNCVRFSPDGNKFVSVSSDKTGFLYDGKTGDKVGELSSTNGHTAGIYSASWSKDSKQILTASADKTAKLFNADDGSVITTFNVVDNPTTDHQLLGSLWQGNTMAVLGLTSDIYVLDPAAPNKPKKVIKGHNKIVAAVAHSKGTLFTADFTPRLLGWNIENAETFEFTGNGHNNKITRILVQGEKLVTASMDDSIRISSIKDQAFGGESVSFDSAPVDIAVGKKDTSLIVVILTKTLIIVKNGKIASKTALTYEASSVALSVDETQIVVGGQDKNIHLYTLSGDKVSDAGIFGTVRGIVTSLEYSPDGGRLASADSNRDVIVWEVSSKKVLISGWQFHNAKIVRVAWSPNGIHLASVGLDGMVFGWNCQKTDNRISQKDAHKGGVFDVVFVSDNVIATVGQDCALKTWTLNF